MAGKNTLPRSGSFAMDGSINTKPPTKTRPQSPKAQIALSRAQAVPPPVAPAKKPRG